MNFRLDWKAGKPVILEGKYTDNGRVLGSKSLQFYATKYYQKITKEIQMDVEQLVQKGATLKAQITELSEQLKAIDIELAGKADYKPGSKTGHMVAGGFKVTVSLKDNVKWDQIKLLQIKELLPDAFSASFIPEYKPASAKALDAVIKQDENFAKAISWAREVTPGKPAVKYEALEEEVQFVTNQTDYVDDDIPF